MARATAYCTCAKCNSSFKVVTTKANRREADSWEEWAQANITECDDCRAARVEAARAEAAKAAIAEASALGLPSLTGSEKQVKWAETIRMGIVTNVINYFFGDGWKTHPELCCHPDKVTNIGNIVMDMLHDKTYAGWWIEHRGDSVRIIVRALRRENPEKFRAIVVLIHGEEAVAEYENREKDAKEEHEEVAQRYEATPENVLHKGSVDLMERVDGGIVTVLARYQKDDDFREIVKSMGFIWKEGLWQCRETEKTGKAEDIIAETGNKLLANGFSVGFESANLRRNAVEGCYTPQKKRWISVSSEGFFVEFERNKDLYNAIKEIPGAYYESPGIIIPERSWREMQDLSLELNFEFTAEAKERMALLEKNSINVKVKRKNEEVKKKKRKDLEIIPDLMEEECGS